MADLAAGVTKIRNLSAKKQHFGFLPPHGRTLASGATYTVRGNVFAAHILRTPRAMSGLQAKLTSGEIALSGASGTVQADPLVSLTKVDTNSVKLTFKYPVDKTTAETETNYQVSGTGIGTNTENANPSTATLSSDKLSVQLDYAQAWGTDEGMTIIITLPADHTIKDLSGTVIPAGSVTYTTPAS